MNPNENFKLRKGDRILIIGSIPVKECEEFLIKAKKN